MLMRPLAYWNLRNKKRRQTMTVLDIEIFDTKSKPPPIAKYLVHGHDDVYWTDNIEDVLYFLRINLEDIERRQK